MLCFAVQRYQLMQKLLCAQENMAELPFARAANRAATHAGMWICGERHLQPAAPSMPVLLYLYR